MSTTARGQFTLRLVVLGLAFLATAGVIVAGVGGPVIETSTEPKDNPTSVTYTVTDVDPLNDTVSMTVEYNINGTVDEASVDVGAAPNGETQEVVNTGESLVIDLTLTDTAPQSPGKFVNLDTTYGWWPDISGTYTTESGTEGNLGSYNQTDQKVAVTTAAESETNGAGSPIYENMNIGYTDSGYLLSTEPVTRTTSENATIVAVEGVSDEANEIERLTNHDHLKSAQAEVFLVDSSPRSSAGAAARLDNGGFFWADVASSSSSIVVEHEYAHLVQPYSVGTELQWWIEGSANYMGAKAAIETKENPDVEAIRQDAFQTGFYNTAAMYENFNTDGELEEPFQEMRLNDPQTWAGGIDYKRGSRLAYIIDKEIRAHSDGQEDIFTLNAQLQEYDTIDYATFQSYVQQLTDGDFTDRLDNYVERDEPVLTDEALMDALEEDPITDR